MEAWLNMKPSTKNAKKAPLVRKKTKTSPAKKKKTNVKNTLTCPTELITAHQAGKLRFMLDAMNTNEIKALCLQCKVPRSGAKYKIIALLTSHVEKVALVSSCGGDQHSKYGVLTLEFSHLTFGKAHTKFCKLDATFKSKMSKEPVDAKERWETMVAAARGFDHVIYEAITGTNRKKYNGSRGEVGIEANADVGGAVCLAFVELCVAYETLMDGNVTKKDIDEGMAFITNNTKCEPYGFYNYNCFLKNATEEYEDQFEVLSEELRNKISEIMVVPQW